MKLTPQLAFAALYVTLFTIGAAASGGWPGAVLVGVTLTIAAILGWLAGDSNGRV